MAPSIPYPATYTTPFPATNTESASEFAHPRRLPAPFTQTHLRQLLPVFWLYPGFRSALFYTRITLLKKSHKTPESRFATETKAEFILPGAQGLRVARASRISDKCSLSRVSSLRQRSQTSRLSMQRYTKTDGASFLIQASIFRYISSRSGRK